MCGDQIGNGIPLTVFVIAEWDKWGHEKSKKQRFNDKGRDGII
jgi:hypothetical protein